jgi:protein-S-isoprenylcysteine O-methyltransferase Ste14
MASNAPPPGARIPPPLLFIATFLIGLYAHRRIIGPLGSSSLSTAVGLLLTVCGVALAVSAAGLFARLGTTLVPHHSSSVLVAKGPYRFTRNPMYLSLAMLYVGATVWTGAWIALALIVVPLGLIMRVFIPMEERQLHERFGESYDAYRARVRRWL